MGYSPLIKSAMIIKRLRRLACCLKTRQAIIFSLLHSLFINQVKDLKESSFDPNTHNFTSNETKDSDYAEAKRQAEVAFYNYAEFPTTYVRFPIVLGRDDYTGRLKFHIERVKNQTAIYFPNIDAKISFISSDQAAEALKFLINFSGQGALNISSETPISLRDFTGIIGKQTNQLPIIEKEFSEKNHSPYGIEEDWFMNCSKLKDLGHKIGPVSNWLPSLI